MGDNPRMLSGPSANGGAGGSSGGGVPSLIGNGGKGGAPASDGHSLLVSGGMVLTLAVADSRIEPAVRDIDQQVHDKYHRGN